MEWLNMDSAPIDGRDILLHVDGVAIQGRYVNDSSITYWDYVRLNSHGCGCCSCDDPEPDGWIPLPPPPVNVENKSIDTEQTK